MDAITALTKLDFPLLFLSVCAALFGVKAILSLLEWFIQQLGLETKWMREKRKDHELLLTTSQNLLLLQEHHKRDMERSDLLDQEMRDDIKRLTDLFIEKEIDDIRWEINNFATKVAEGKPCNRTAFPTVSAATSNMNGCWRKTGWKMGRWNCRWRSLRKRINEN